MSEDEAGDTPFKDVINIFIIILILKTIFWIKSNK